MERRHFNTLLLALTPSSLRAQGGPRLFLNAARVDALKASILTTHAELWRSARRKADSIIAKGIPKYSEAAEPNDEMLWQREVGNKIPLLALVSLLVDDQKYFAATVAWTTACCRYPHWGMGSEDGSGLAAGHLLFSLALVYDWLGKCLPEDVRELLRGTLLQRGAIMYSAATGELPLERSYWRLLYMTNRLWVNAAGLAAAGWALGDEPGASKWVELAFEKFRRTETFRAGDGASHEGIGYWSYGLEYQLKFWHLAADLAGVTASGDWWKNTAAYRQYLALPRNAWKEDNTAVDFADSERADGYGADHLLYRLAALHRDPHAQWLAGELKRAGVTNSISHWLDLLWFDPTVPAKAPADLPTQWHFGDMGIVSARSGWSGDESLVVLKCGPPIGHFATDKLNYNLGIGHNHPDANHFVIFGCGEWLLRDDGYAWKDTGQHNTLLVDGKGQAGEGQAWFNAAPLRAVKVHPRILKAVASEQLDEISGDAAVAYPESAGLKRYVRRHYFLKPDVLIVVDDIEVDAPRKLELRFHPEYPCEQRADGSLLARGAKASLRIDLLTRDGVAVTAGDINGRDKAGRPMPMHTVQMQVTRDRWKNLVAFSWAPGSSEPVRLSLERAGEEWVVRAGARSVRVEF